jgi:hypothetical protein
MFFIGFEIQIDESKYSVIGAEVYRCGSFCHCFIRKISFDLDIRNSNFDKIREVNGFKLWESEVRSESVVLRFKYFLKLFDQD